MEIEDTGTAPVTPAATEDLRVESPSEAPAETSSDEAITADLQKIWDSKNPPRAEDGKFASTKEQEPGEEAEAPETEGQAPEIKEPEKVESPSIEPPISWPREMKEKWSSLPPDAQELIARREGEAHSKITRLGDEVAQTRPIAQVIEQHKDVFARHGMSHDRGIALLLAAQRQLDENPVAAIADLARRAGVDLSIFANGDGQSTQTPEIASLQAEIKNLKAELSETSGYVRSTQEREQQAKATQIEATLDNFLTGKDIADGDIPELAVLIQAEQQLNPGKTAEEWLASAYETFQFRRPERREAFISKQVAETEAKRQEEAAKKAAEAKKHASLNVKSSPGASSSSRTIDDDLKEIARRAYSPR